MPSSALATATRAFVTVLLVLAREYELALEINRDSPAEELVKAYKKVLLKTHPDKGGRKEHMQKLQAAKEEWERVRKSAGTKPGPRGGQATGDAMACTVLEARLSARGRHHEIALSRDESFFRISFKIFSPSPFQIPSIFFDVPRGGVISVPECL